MDFFGIGAAITGCVRIYLQSARATGRTTSLLDSLKNGDRVYFATTQEMRHFQNRCKERKLEIECVVIPPNDPSRIFDRGSSQGRAVFDHGWVEQYYLNAIDQCGKDIAHFERETSGFGEAHLETRRKFAQLSKWHV